MNTPSNESKLDLVIAGYLDVLETSGHDSRDQLILENPDLESELRSFFSSHDAMRRAGFVSRSRAAHER